MATAEVARKPAPKDAGAAPRPAMWGITDVAVLAALQGKQVEAHLTTSKVLTGALIGYSAYTLTLKVGQRIVLIGKGAIAWLAEASTGSD